PPSLRAGRGAGLLSNAPTVGPELLPRRVATGEQLCFLGGRCGLQAGGALGAVSCDGVEDGEKLPHGGDEGDLLDFPASDQAPVEGTDGRIDADGGERSHVEAAPHGSPPSPSLPGASVSPTVAPQRGDA